MSMLNQPRQEGEFPDWEALYAAEPVQSLPWYTSEPDQDLQQTLAAQRMTSGTFLDVGAGPGTQAAWLALQGFQVTASDVSQAAVAAAAQHAHHLGVRVTCVVDNILASALEGPFDYIFDRGCFHVLPPDSRPIYVQTLHRLLSKSGQLFLKCFSLKETVVQGPYRFSQQTIETLFSSHFQLLTCKESRYEGNHTENPHTLFTVFRPR